jgi:DNA replication initiation complex subunit (GINS family)
MLTDETIRKIFEDERNSPGLTRLSDDFFEQVREYLEKKISMSRDETDQWALEAVKRRLKTIFERRERKILNSAHGFVDSGVIPENMTNEERMFFERIVECVNGFQKEREEKLERKKEKLVMVTLLDQIPAFVGINMKNYGPFSKGDIATLPEPNADLLTKKGLAEKIEMTDY